MQALAAAPDGELVRVEERDQQVVITKQGRTLKVQVTAGALSSLRFTDLVDVRDGQDHVRVRVS